MADKREIGVVKRFDHERGFGFIGRSGGEDVYVNQREVERAGLGSLDAGDRVSFVVVRSHDNRTRAEQLSREGGATPPKASAGVSYSVLRPDTHTDFRFGPEYLSEGYFEQRGDKRYLRPAVLDSLAIDAAKALGNAGMKSAQLRRFFGKARGIESRLARDNDFEAIKADIYGFKRDVAYQVGRKIVPEAFQQFINRNVELAVVDAESFRTGFLQHFESVVAYFVYYFRDQ